MVAIRYRWPRSKPHHLDGRVGVSEAELRAIKKPRAKMKRPEQDFQIKAVIPYLDAILMPRETFYFHVPNGGARSPVEAGILKAMGVRAGFPDIVVFALAEPILGCGNGHRICLIELKRPDGTGRLSEPQKKTHAALADLALVPFLCSSLADVKSALEQDGIPIRKHSLTGNGAYFVDTPAR